MPMLEKRERQKIFDAAAAKGISEDEIQIEEFPDEPSGRPDGTYFPGAGKIKVTIRSRSKTYECVGRVSFLKVLTICQDIERGLFGR